MASVDRVTELHKNNEVQYLCFRLEKGGELYAVNVFKVQEIIKYDKRPTVVEYGDNTLLEGLITVRDMTVPLVDMKKWFSYAAQEQTLHDKVGLNAHDSQVMLCDFSGVFIGIRIYRADRILTKKWEEIYPSLNAGSGFDQKINNYTYYTDESLVQIVDIEKMISEVFPFLEEEVNGTPIEVRTLDMSKFLLIGEDSAVATKILKGILDKLGVRYRFFENGKTLLEFVEENPDEMSRCGLVLTDLEMPEVSGFEVIKRLKENSHYEHIPIAVNSSMSGDSNRDMAYSLGADFFMQKTNANELANLVHRYFAIGE